LLLALIAATIAAREDFMSGGDGVAAVAGVRGAEFGTGMAAA
jgi:hypothetical protein